MDEASACSDSSVVRAADSDSSSGSDAHPSADAAQPHVPLTDELDNSKQAEEEQHDGENEKETPLEKSNDVTGEPPVDVGADVSAVASEADAVDDPPAEREEPIDAAKEVQPLAEKLRVAIPPADDAPRASPRDRTDEPTIRRTVKFAPEAEEVKPLANPRPPDTSASPRASAMSPRRTPASPRPVEPGPPPPMGQGAKGLILNANLEEALAGRPGSARPVIDRRKVAAAGKTPTNTPQRPTSARPQVGQTPSARSVSPPLSIGGVQASPPSGPRPVRSPPPRSPPTRARSPPARVSRFPDADDEPNSNGKGASLPGLDGVMTITAGPVVPLLPTRASSAGRVRPSTAGQQRGRDWSVLATGEGRLRPSSAIEQRYATSRGPTDKSVAVTGRTAHQSSHVRTPSPFYKTTEQLFGTTRRFDGPPTAPTGWSPRGAPGMRQRKFSSRLMQMYTDLPAGWQLRQDDVARCAGGSPVQFVVGRGLRGVGMLGDGETDRLYGLQRLGLSSSM